ncbi:MAG: hypothetical protein GXP31_05670 [Kiritimatiellaeota bacterium]|nr:hypothetical protein [Kiritimatiellota bacterium]
MKSKKRFIETYVFSTVGIVCMAVLLIAVNIISRAVHDRIDLTADRIYTLSDGTRAILKAIDTPITVQFFYSKDVAQMPVYLKNYANRVEDMLKEYAVESGGKIKVRRLNPTPDSDAEDAAHLAGIYGQSIGLTGDKIFFGLAITCLDQTATIPFLSPQRENLLEYDLTRAIYRVLHPDKPVLGLMSSLPVMGNPQPMMMPGMPPQNNRKPWLLVSELKRDFDVRKVETTAESIDDDISVLLLIHPKDLSDKTLFALDQFVLRGGKLIAFLDPMSIVDSRTNPMSQMRRMPPSASTLGKLLDAWGIKFNTEKVVADMVYMTRVQGRDGQPQSMPTVLSLTRDAVQRDDPVTSQLSSLLVAFGGAFEGDGADGLEKEVLFHTSDQCQLVEKFMAQMPGNAVLRDFKPEGRAMDLALRLTGTFKTAFPDGKPGAAEANDKKKDTDNKKEKDKAASGALKKSAKPGTVVLVGDSDMLFDNFCVRRNNLFGQEFITPLNDNLSFAQNLVEQLSGDNNLISIRGRTITARPFLVVRRMKAEAEQQYQDQIRKLEDDLAETRRKISELERRKGKTSQRLELTPEQRSAIKKFRQKEAETNRQLKLVRKKLRRRIDALETKVEWANIALMPALVALGGIVLALVKRRRTAHK